MEVVKIIMRPVLNLCLHIKKYHLNLNIVTSIQENTLEAV